MKVSFSHSCYHIFKVVIITVDDPKEGSLNPESLIDSIEVFFELKVSIEL